MFICHIILIFVTWFKWFLKDKYHMSCRHNSGNYNPIVITFLGHEIYQTSFFCLLILTIFNEGAYSALKLMFHKALKDGIIAIWERASDSLFMLSTKQVKYWYHIFYRLWSWSGIEPVTSGTLTTMLSSCSLVYYLSRTWDYDVSETVHKFIPLVLL